MEPMQGPLIPAQDHSCECWPLPRSSGTRPNVPCDCPLITGPAAPGSARNPLDK